MKISELIKELADILAYVGDCKVTLDNKDIHIDIHIDIDFGAYNKIPPQCIIYSGKNKK